MHYLCRMPRSSPMVACQISQARWGVFGAPLNLWGRRRGVVAAAAASLAVAAGRAAEVAARGERLPFFAVEVAAFVSGGDGARGAADVFCGAADVRCNLSHTPCKLFFDL